MNMYMQILYMRSILSIRVCISLIEKEKYIYSKRWIIPVRDRETEKACMDTMCGYHMDTRTLKGNAWIPCVDTRTCPGP
jgi:hypothetical protein